MLAVVSVYNNAPGYYQPVACFGGGAHFCYTSTRHCTVEYEKCMTQIAPLPLPLPRLVQHNMLFDRVRESLPAWYTRTQKREPFHKSSAEPQATD